MPDDTTRVWLVERTYSDDEQNLVVLTYATPDGERSLRKERPLTSFGDVRDTHAGLDVSADDLAPVRDDETRALYARAASDTAADHDASDVI